MLFPEAALQAAALATQFALPKKVPVVDTGVRIKSTAQGRVQSGTGLPSKELPLLVLGCATNSEDCQPAPDLVRHATCRTAIRRSAMPRGLSRPQLNAQAAADNPIVRPLRAERRLA